MKTNHPSESNTRLLFRSVPRSLGILLALVILVTFSSPARADQCAAVDFDELTHFPSTAYTALTTATSGATIYYTVGEYGCPADPTHSSQVYSTPIGCPPNQKRYIKAFAAKAGMTDSAIGCYEVDNTNS